MEKELTITISGAAATGKSTLALMIEDFLEEQGFDVKLDLEPEIEDYGTEVQFRAVCSFDWHKKLRRLKNELKITVKQIRTCSGSKEESQTKTDKDN